MRNQVRFLFLALAPSLLLSQDARGTIFGTVTDQQAALITGANVAVTNTDTGTASKLATNAAGYYEAPLLLPGPYSVTVESPGFKKVVRAGITVSLSDRLQVDITLEVGATAESVTVTSEAPMLDTNTVASGRNISNCEVMDLPVVGNNVGMLARFSPGVQVPGTTQFLVQGQVGGGSAYSAAGGVGGNEWSIDGASTNGTRRTKRAEIALW